MATRLLIAYPCYSVDASAMIQLHHEYPRDIRDFAPLWDFLGGLAEQGRLLICEQARDECEDDVVNLFFEQHPHMVVPAEDTLNYALRLGSEDQQHGIGLVDPDATEQDADPFVVALALMVEQRDLNDLRRRARPEAVCSVVSYETRKGRQWRPGGSRAKIPDVCGFYDLACIRWPALLRAEGH
jgi:hypothetical protein